MDSLGSSRFDWKWRCLREWSQKPSSSSSIIISPSWVLCSSCWGSSSGSWTWSMVSVDCRHYAPGPPLNDKTHSETHTTPQTVYSLYVTLYVCDTHRNTGRVCPHPCYTHWRIHERSDTHRTPPSVTHTHTLYKTKHLPLPDSTVHLIPTSATVQLITEWMHLN